VWHGRPALARVLKPRLDQKIILAQSVGYPKKHIYLRPG